jgi:glycosyltransferase involved in cell wall biosynthesis
MKRIKTLDIVTSAKNEESNIKALYERIVSTMSSHDIRWRLIICDNVSSDDTWGIIQGLAKKDERVLGVKMSRDFGFEGSIAGGLSLTNADAIVMMASDLQDPPEAISQLVYKFEEGFDHVFQIVTRRPGSGFFRRLNSRLFYSVASKLSNGLIYPNSSIFRIMSREVVGQLNTFKERNRFIRALAMYVGYKSAPLEIARDPRPKGESKASTGHVLGLGLRGILSNSSGLLDLVGYVGILVSGLSVITAITFATIWIIVGVPFAGFGLLTSVLLFGFGFSFLALGILAQYISLIYEEVKARPNFIIAETTNKDT